MWCTKLNNTHLENVGTLDETLQVRGCLGRLLQPSKSRKRQGQKLPTQVSCAPPVCKAKPSVVVLPSPHQAQNHGKSKENVAPNTNFQSTRSNSESNRRPRNRAKQSNIKGQIRLGFHINGNIIVLQVIEAKKFKAKTSFTVGDCYFVSIELASDDGESKRQRTKNVYDRNPVFNEEFVMRVRNISPSSRLVITTYKLSPTGYKELIGCMSFGVSNLLQKCSSGNDTYYLLSRVLGMRKHLRVSQAGHLSTLADTTGISSLSTMLNQGNRSKSNVHRNNSGASISPTPSEILADDLYDGSFSGGELEPTMLRQVSVCVPIRNRQEFNPVNRTEKPLTPNQGQISRPIGDLDQCSFCEVTETSSVRNKYSLMSNHSTAATRATCIESSNSFGIGCDLQSTDLDTRNNFRIEYSEAEKLCLRLTQAEDKFVDVMHQGVQRFSRPLRHALLTPYEHSVLFQNVEKLLAISEFHFKRLHDALAKSRASLCPVGEIYLAQIAVLCEAYITYFKGISAAERLLTSLWKRSRFVQFLNQNITDGPAVGLDTFLQAPQIHLQNLVSIMDDMIVVAAPLREPGFKSLVHIQMALTTCWDQCLEESTLDNGIDSATETSDDNDDLELELDDLGHHDNRGRMAPPAASRVLSASAPAPSNLDSNLLQLQQRLHVCNRICPFKLAIPGRHILFSGELDFVNNWKWTKCWVILMNDMILITQVDEENRMIAVCEPVMLKDILSTQFECLHPGEMLLTARTSCRENAWSHMRTVTFRTCDPEVKSTWRHLLQQRIVLSQDQRMKTL